jgi:hypothetical protein
MSPAGHAPKDIVIVDEVLTAGAPFLAMKECSASGFPASASWESFSLGEPMRRRTPLRIADSLLPASARVSCRRNLKMSISGQLQSDLGSVARRERVVVEPVDAGVD